MNEIEIFLVKKFFKKSAQDRPLRLLTSKRGRSSFVDELRNFNEFDYVSKKSISLNDKPLVKDALCKHSIKGKVFVVSVYEKYDGWMDVGLALDKLFGSLGGTIISSEDFKCIYYEGEYSDSRVLLMKD